MIMLRIMSRHLNSLNKVRREMKIVMIMKREKVMIKMILTRILKCINEKGCNVRSSIFSSWNLLLTRCGER